MISFFDPDPTTWIGVAHEALEVFGVCFVIFMFYRRKGA